MDIQKHDKSIHPDEWINDLITNFHHNHDNKDIKTSNEVDNYNKLCNALQEDISFTIIKNTNKRILELLKCAAEGEKSSKFISDFRKLCYNAEINDMGYLYKSLSLYYFNYISSEFTKKMRDVNSINELIKEFDDIVLEESNLITNGSNVVEKKSDEL